MTTNGHILAAFKTDRGQVREHNEDFVTIYEPETHLDEVRNGRVYLVADGVGGADAGEIASRFTCERTIYHYLQSDPDPKWKRRLRRAVEKAHHDLCDLIDSRRDNRRMGTTLVAAVLAEKEAFLANVGDSRGYLVRQGEIRQITKDHSLIAKLLEEGIISPTEAASLNIGNIILQSIGSEQPPQVDLFSVPLQEEDLLLLCSDGLSNHVSDQEMAEIVSAYPPEEASRRLVELANKRGGYDNITVLVVKYEMEIASSPNGRG